MHEVCSTVKKKEAANKAGRVRIMLNASMQIDINEENDKEN